MHHRRHRHTTGGGGRAVSVAYLGASHARRVACAPVPRDNRWRAIYLAPGSAKVDVRTILTPLFRSCFGLPAHPAPDGVVVSIGGNSLACRTAPHAVVHNAADVAEKIVECTKRVLGSVERANVAIGGQVVLQVP